MAERKDLPRIPTNERPTFWNAGAAKGLFFGKLIGGIAAEIAAATITGGAALPISITAALTPAIAGLYIGGTNEKAQMTDDLIHGKTVKDPTFWNKNIFEGWTRSFLITVPVAVAASLGAFASAPLLGTIAITTAAIASIYMPIKAGLEGKADMQRDMDYAKAIQQQQSLSLGVAPQLGVAMQQPALAQHQAHAQTQVHSAPETSYKNSVTPQEYAMLQQRIAAGKDGGAAMGQHASKAIAASQAPAQPTSEQPLTA